MNQQLMEKNIQSFSAHAQKIVQAARLHANNLLRCADELEKLINPVIESAINNSQIKNA